MLIIWSGWGALTILIVAVVSIAVGAILQLVLAAIGYPQLTFWRLASGCSRPPRRTGSSASD